MTETTRANEKIRILVVDDEHLIRWTLEQRLERNGWTVIQAANGAEALEQFSHGVDLVLLDYFLPDSNGAEVFAKMRASDPTVPVIMLTAQPNVSDAVEMMKGGAFHYGQKDENFDDAVENVQRALNRSSRFAVSRLAGSHLDQIIGETEVIRGIRDLIERTAPSAAHVMITGEHGTGRTLTARTFHRRSARAQSSLVSISCTGLSVDVVERQLFGAESKKGSERTVETGLLEQANGGAIIIDEIGELSAGTQNRLARMLDEGVFRRVGGSADVAVDVRVIATSCYDPRIAIERKRFHEELYYRLAGITVRLPPLRERTPDIALLTEYFRASYARDTARQVGELTPAAVQKLEESRWPGNVLQLRSSVERAVLVCKPPKMEAADFEVPDKESMLYGEFNLPPSGVKLLDIEKQLLVQALDRTKGNRTRAGKLLGMNRDQIRYRIEKFGIEAEKDDDRETDEA